MSDRWSIFSKETGERVSQWIYPNFSQAELSRKVSRYGPYGPEDTETREMSEECCVATPSESGAEAVIEAWTNAGPAPIHHYNMKAMLHDEWPALAMAIERLVNNE